MRMRLSRGELAVLADHLSVDPTFAIGAMSETEMHQAKAEGWRSLIVRGFARGDGDVVEISSDLAAQAMDILAPNGLLAYTRVIDEKAEISTVLVGRDGLLSVTPLWDGVGSYSSVDPGRIVDVIVGDLDLPDASVGIYRLELVNGVEQKSETMITWARSGNGDVVGLKGDEGIQVSADQIRSALIDVVGASSELAREGTEQGGIA